MFGRHYFGARHFGPRYFGDGGSVAPIPPASAPPSGGFFEVPHRERPRSVKEERERLGIFPKAAKKTIRAVAKQAEDDDKSDQQALEMLLQELERQNLVYRQQYAIALEQERQRIHERARMDLQIQLAMRLRKKQQDDEDEYEAEMLLM